MWIEKNLEQEGIVLHSYEDAASLMRILVENGNCAMLSQEENLWVVNWVWTSEFANRNQVIFISREIYEYEMEKWQKRHPELKCEEDEYYAAV